MINISKEQIALAKKALNQIGAQIESLCVDILGLAEMWLIIDNVEKEMNNESL